jgi:hypothetical protein
MNPGEKASKQRRKELSKEHIPFLLAVNERNNENRPGKSMSR